MEKKTVFIKRYPSKGELPKVSQKYFTSHGYSDYSVKTNEWCDEDWLELDVEWFLEEIELPSEEEIQSVAPKTRCVNQFWDGANFILNHLKK